MAFAPRLCRQARHDQFITNGEVVLQGLTEVGNLARPFIENDGLVKEVFFQLLADEIDFRTEDFQQLQAVF